MQTRTREEGRRNGHQCTADAKVHVDDGEELAGPEALVIPKLGQLLMIRGRRMGRARSE